MITTTTAITQHGARCVYDAACARLSGDASKLAAIGLYAKTLADANAIMSAAFAAMSNTDKASDLTDITVKQAARK